MYVFYIFISRKLHHLLGSYDNIKIIKILDHIYCDYQILVN